MPDYYVPEWETRAQYEENKVREQWYKEDREQDGRSRRDIQQRTLYRLQQEGLVCSRCGTRIKIKPNTHSIVCGCGNFIKVR